MKAVIIGEGATAWRWKFSPLKNSLISQNSVFWPIDLKTWRKIFWATLHICTKLGSDRIIFEKSFVVVVLVGKKGKWGPNFEKSHLLLKYKLSIGNYHILCVQYVHQLSHRSDIQRSCVITTRNGFPTNKNNGNHFGTVTTAMKLFFKYHPISINIST